MFSNVNLASLAEQMCRMEHKLDLILRNQASASPEASLLPLNSQEHFCPVCTEVPRHQVDVFSGHVTRTCGCSTGKVPFNNALAPSNTQQGSDDGGSAD